MLILYELDGYKYLGRNPNPPFQNLSKNLTFIVFEITDWLKDIEMLNFLCSHTSIDKIDQIKDLIRGWVKDNKTEKLYLVIRQDDDIAEYNGIETITLSNIRPIEIPQAPLFFLRNVQT